MSGACLADFPGALDHGPAGGHHVVHQEDVPALDCIRTADAESAFEIAQALPAREARLTLHPESSI